MLDAAETVEKFTRGVLYDRYAVDRMMQLAVEREIEIIGEAAGRVSQSFKAAHPEVPWQAMVAQRNVLAHEYGDINQDRIWLVATVRIPGLVRLLRPLIPPAPTELPS